MTLLPQESNEKSRFFRTLENWSLINRMVFPNLGVSSAASMMEGRGELKRVHTRTNHRKSVESSTKRNGETNQEISEFCGGTGCDIIMTEKVHACSLNLSRFSLT